MHGQQNITFNSSLFTRKSQIYLRTYNIISLRPAHNSVYEYKRHILHDPICHSLALYTSNRVTPSLFIWMRRTTFNDIVDSYILPQGRRIGVGNW